MSGDGANDAAAIRLADVGIGMGAHGSTSARSAADLVLTRPDVGLLLDALVEGRAMWRRVRDAVAVLLGGNAGEVGFTLALLLAGLVQTPGVSQFFGCTPLDPLAAAGCATVLAAAARRHLAAPEVAPVDQSHLQEEEPEVR
ncbi:MAG TPA: hypothetical protein VE823_19760 [Geodermatophilus sp.]|nr:hypothetical protein [Geodermatophilus sp.]